MQKEKWALLAVYDKTEIVEFARGLIKLGWGIIASRGTAKVIAEAGLPVSDVAEFAGGEPILGHRVVTLSRPIYAALLAQDKPEDWQELERIKIPRIDLVCVDLYPLKQTIAAVGSTRESVAELTDIGGPTLLRAAAKGDRLVICDPADRDWLLGALADGSINPFVRQKLAAKAEAWVADYCLTSARFLGDGHYDGWIGQQSWKLCYGENRLQGRSDLLNPLPEVPDDELGLNYFSSIAGSAPSFINLTDVDRALEFALMIAANWQANFGQVPYLAVGVKHGNVCGAGIGRTNNEALTKMIAGDPQALSGGTVLTNFTIADCEAVLLRSYRIGPQRIIDVVTAPEITELARELLDRKHGKCRMLINPALAKLESLTVLLLDRERRFRQVRGGFLTQEAPQYTLAIPESWPALVGNEKEDLLLGDAVARRSRSNSIIIVKDGMVLGTGISQCSRVMACKVALLQARENKHEVRGATACSDSFFPFPDGPIVLAEAGVKTIFATSGSVKDEGVRQACKERGVRLLQLPDEVARGFHLH